MKLLLSRDLLHLNVKKQKKINLLEGLQPLIIYFSPQGFFFEGFFYPNGVEELSFDRKTCSLELVY